jgi:diaminobutyrate acetyltransferase
LLAEDGGRLLGFVSAFRPPTRADVLFVWQVAVAAVARGAGIGGRMLTDLVQRAAGGDVRYLEATVTPSNTASQKLFESFARRQGAPLAKQCLFPAELFPDTEQHEAEDLFRIGPLPSTTPTKE